MVGLRAKVLGRLGRKPSPHPRACALSCPSLVVYRAGVLQGGSGPYTVSKAARWAHHLLRGLRFATVQPLKAPPTGPPFVHAQETIVACGRPFAGGSDPGGPARCGILPRVSLL